MLTDRVNFRRHRRNASLASMFGPAFAGLFLWGGLALAALPAHAQSSAPTAAATPDSKPPTASTKPLWTELSSDQQRALSPLAPHWNELHVAQKRKWIALSRNFDSMSAEDQAVLHSRMTEWAALTAQERTRARLNFAEVKRLAPKDEQQAKWEAYQALSEEEKRKLAARAGSRPPSAAAPVRPVPAQKLAPVPSGQNAPRIQLAPTPATTPAPAKAASAVDPKPVEAP
ncbi:MAG TPA: DUF3106 domain-containing protein [Variovorax sp.]|nr:DUF3106 domain-containing protein [Variovorax sp.]